MTTIVFFVKKYRSLPRMKCPIFLEFRIQRSKLYFLYLWYLLSPKIRIWWQGNLSIAGGYNPKILEFDRFAKDNPSIWGGLSAKILELWRHMGVQKMYPLRILLDQLIQVVILSQTLK